ncbi:MAG: PilZ domain-containing protein [Deltaproteobacteria bacterium]|nr:PilZ domain-containing protein [Deltaproteobacteria bacterium]MDQ3301386.1 PilZ domain-containing protein [Myxococcota bacterium]
MSDQRRAARLVVNAPAVIESIGQVPMFLHPNLQAVFRRVDADTTTLGKRFPAVVRDLSTNGAFITGAPLPLLARVALKFEVRGIGPVDAVGWVMWQRTNDCDLPVEGGTSTLPKGFGVLFESIPLETRTAIAALVAKQ